MHGPLILETNNTLSLGRQGIAVQHNLLQLSIVGVVILCFWQSCSHSLEIVEWSWPAKFIPLAVRNLRGHAMH
jgi:hypothetical protein